MTHQEAAEAIVSLLEKIVDEAPDHDSALKLGRGLLDWAGDVAEALPRLGEVIDAEALKRANQ